MKQIFNKKINEYMAGTTGPNRTGLFARVVPGKYDCKFSVGVMIFMFVITH